MIRGMKERAKGIVSEREDLSSRELGEDFYTFRHGAKAVAGEALDAPDTNLVGTTFGGYAKAILGAGQGTMTIAPPVLPPLGVLFQVFMQPRDILRETFCARRCEHVVVSETLRARCRDLFNHFGYFRVFIAMRYCSHKMVQKMLSTHCALSSGLTGSYDERTLTHSA